MNEVGEKFFIICNVDVELYIIINFMIFKIKYGIKIL